MTLARLNYLNIGLMLVAATAALLLPFETFVLAYVVLGPLHYFTEIAWLRERQFFTTGKRDYWWLVGCCLLVFGWFMLNKLQPSLLLRFPDSNMLEALPGMTNQGYGGLIFAAFAGALAMVLSNNTVLKAASVLLGAVFGWLLMSLTSVYVVVGMLLPSLIHVFLFTGIFLFTGALQGKGSSGFLASLVFVVCGAALLLVQPGLLGYPANDTLFSAWLVSDFYPLNNILLSWMESGQHSFNDVFRSDVGLRIQRFIAFAYFYHYLNWFSKTGIIGWHKVSRPWLVGAGILWMGSLALWWWNAVYGFAALFLLSMLHVFLEFPLNHKSFVRLGQLLAGNRNRTESA